MWICSECGIKYGSCSKDRLSTWHFDTCQWCGKMKACTEDRDFNYPEPIKKQPVDIDNEKTISTDSNLGE